jgi:hypothetical protein
MKSDRSSPGFDSLKSESDDCVPSIRMLSGPAKSGGSPSWSAAIGPVAAWTGWGWRFSAGIVPVVIGMLVPMLTVAVPGFGDSFSRMLRPPKETPSASSRTDSSVRRPPCVSNFGSSNEPADPAGKFSPPLSTMMEKLSVSVGRPFRRIRSSNPSNRSLFLATSCPLSLAASAGCPTCCPRIPARHAVPFTMSGGCRLCFWSDA